MDLPETPVPLLDFNPQTPTPNPGEQRNLELQRIESEMDALRRRKEDLLAGGSGSAASVRPKAEEQVGRG